MQGVTLSTGQINLAKNVDWGPVYIQLLDAADQPVPLTGSVIELQIRQREADRTALVAITTHDPLGVEDGVSIVDAAQGIFALLIVRGKSKNLAPGTFVSDLVRTKSDGLSERLWMGEAIVAEGVTR